MRKIRYLILLFTIIPLLANAQFRMLGELKWIGWDLESNTGSVFFYNCPDFTGEGYLPPNIERGYRIITVDNQLWEITGVFPVNYSETQLFLKRISDLSSKSIFENSVCMLFKQKENSEIPSYPFHRVYYFSDKKLIWLMANIEIHNALLKYKQ